MIGIYKITNKITNKSYIGQSRDIKKRWNNHKIASKNPSDNSYDYPLYKAFRKYGIDNFVFEILEECEIKELNNKEQFWINYYKPNYNQAPGGGYNIVPQKLTYLQVEEIQNILINNNIYNLSYEEIANKYGVHKDSIRNINNGRSWVKDNYTYPLYVFTETVAKKWFCSDCGKEISKGSNYCKDCYKKIVVKNNIENLPVTREELKKMIRTMPFTKIGAKFNLTDNAIRKWCIKLNLPSKSKEIHSYSDEEWEKI